MSAKMYFLYENEEKREGSSFTIVKPRGRCSHAVKQDEIPTER